MACYCNKCGIYLPKRGDRPVSRNFARFKSQRWPNFARRSRAIPLVDQSHFKAARPRVTGLPVRRLQSTTKDTGMLTRYSLESMSQQICGIHCTLTLKFSIKSDQPIFLILRYSISLEYMRPTADHSPIQIITHENSEASHQIWSFHDKLEQPQHEQVRPDDARTANVPLNGQGGRLIWFSVWGMLPDSRSTLQRHLRQQINQR